METQFLPLGRGYGSEKQQQHTMHRLSRTALELWWGGGVLMERGQGGQPAQVALLQGVGGSLPGTSRTSGPTHVD